MMKKNKMILRSEVKKVRKIFRFLSGFLVFFSLSALIITIYHVIMIDIYILFLTIFIIFNLIFSYIAIYIAISGYPPNFFLWTSEKLNNTIDDD